MLSCRKETAEFLRTIRSLKLSDFLIKTIFLMIFRLYSNIHFKQLKRHIIQFDFNFWFFISLGQEMILWLKQRFYFNLYVHLHMLRFCLFCFVLNSINE